MRPIVAVALCLFVCATHAEEKAAGLTYERDIRPILKAYCFDCHGATKEMKGGLDLRLARLMIKGGESGAAINPGDATASYLIERVTSGEMPPGEKKLAADQIDILKRWIAAGAPTVRPEPDELDPGIGITPEERAFWSFQPIQRPEVPEFNESERARTAIDALLLADMKPLGLSFSPDANRRTLIQRAYFDLLGLPPKPQEIADFVADDSPDAYETLIDRLLESKHYGERWARHWLDIAGYADSEGYTNNDADRPWAYFYRDYVIRSFNADKPLDQFIREQLADDEMVPLPHKNLTPEQIEKLTATGFLRMAADGTGSGANDDAARNQTMADTIKIVSTSLLGLSVGCAQCHDHRYDPIPQVDYYQLRSVFEPALDWKNWRTPVRRLVSLYTDQDRATAAKVEAEAKKIGDERLAKQKQYIDEALEKELARHPAELWDELRTAYRTAGDKRTDRQKKLLKQYPSVNISPGNLYQYNQKHADDLKTYDKRMADVRKKKPVERFLRVLTEAPGKVPVTHVFHRGEFKQPTDAVSPAALTISTPPGKRRTIADNDPSLATTGRRLAYARWLTSGQHPLVARVLVNRIWMHHFGRGIVGTPSDFGVLGERPTHPQLLDWLADEFVAGGWSLKKFHKLIMTSTVYRQTSAAAPDKLAIDGANRLYWKWPVQRLDAEIVRDRILATSGTLSDTVFGPPVNVKADETGQVVVDGGESRRSIYIRVKRTQPVALLKVFDAPVMEVNCECRPSSTVAPQSLMLMNSDFILRHAKKFALRLRKETPTDGKIEVDFELARLGVESPWQYGYGQLNDETKRVEAFMHLPHWTGKVWQGGSKLPDPKLEWVELHADGGHPATAHAAIRRWIAPAKGVVTVTGKINHSSPNGDGVRASVVASRSRVVGQWVAQHGGADTNPPAVEVEPSDAIDLVVDDRGSVTSDGFTWHAKINFKAATGGSLVTDSKADFRGPLPDVSLAPAQVVSAWQLAYGRPPSNEELTAALEFLAGQVAYLKQTTAPADPLLDALTNLCQTLMSSNEFLYME